MTNITAETLDHLKRWEGLKLHAYPDPGSRDGNPWTIGYGHTSDAFFAVREGMVITEAKAEDLLRHDAAEAAEIVDRHVRVALTPNQRGALISFVLNIGEGGSKQPGFSTSTLLKKLNRGQYDAVPAELAKWKYNDGDVMQGLINRRAAEAGLWAKGEFVSSCGTSASTAPASKQLVRPEVITAVGGVLGSGAAIASGDGPVQLAVAFAIGVVVLVGAVIVLRKVLRS